MLTLTLYNFDLNAISDILDAGAFIMPMLDAGHLMLDNLNPTGR